jgi:hypothetical protein
VDDPRRHVLAGPVSPVSSTGIEVRAARASWASTARVAALRPTIAGCAAGAAEPPASSRTRTASARGSPGSDSARLSWAPRRAAATASAAAGGRRAIQIQCAAPTGGAGTRSARTSAIAASRRISTPARRSASRTRGAGRGPIQATEII